MNIIIQIIIGTFVCVIASKQVHEEINIIESIILAILGFILGHFIFWFVGFRSIGFASCIVTVIGTCICLYFDKKYHESKKTL